MVEVSELRDYLGGLGVGSDADDKVLRELEKDAVAYLENRTLRTFEASPASAAKIIDGSGEIVQRLPDPPTGTITVETRVGSSWATEAASTYTVIADELRPRLISHTGVWPFGRDNLRITATVGYAHKAEPAQVRRAVKSLVAHRFVTRLIAVPTDEADPAERPDVPPDVAAFISHWSFYRPHVEQARLVRA